MHLHREIDILLKTGPKMIDYNKMVEEIQQALNKFDGGAARFWDFIHTNDRLIVRMQAPEKREAIFVFFMFCLEISAPMAWIIHQPKIEKISDHEYQFTDKESRIFSASARYNLKGE